MNRSDFYEWVMDFKHQERYFGFADLPNLAESGEVQFATCNFCSYVSDKAPHFTPDNIEEIDRQIINHVYSKHYEDAMKVVRKISIEEIARRPGQQTLEVR